jgi:lipopolysaccharide/colanic/teichoic acid biosynthesis glycosyltransferase
MIIGEIGLLDTQSGAAFPSHQSRHNVRGWLTLPPERTRIYSLSALVLGELVAILLALAVARLIAPASPDWTAVSALDLPIWLGCCVACGLYRRSKSEPYERLRQRVFAVSLFISIQGVSDILSGDLTSGLPYCVALAVVLLLISFYIELFIGHKLVQVRLSKATATPSAEKRPDEISSARAGERPLSLSLATSLAITKSPREAEGCEKPNPAPLWSKRAIDLIIAVPVAILMLPIIGLMATVIKLIDPGPAFYSQDRIGRYGRTVRIFKIRSMYMDADQRLQTLLHSDPAAQAEWGRYFKLRYDPRILGRVGNFIRRSSLDELPQLWNIIRGDMALVGPRPLPAYHAGSFDEDFQRLRASLPPGLTGLSQILVRSDGDCDALRWYDLFYLENRSIWLDLYILLQTVPVVLSGKGAR